MVHVSIVTSTSRIICVRLVTCKSEDTMSAYMLLTHFLNGEEMGFISDEGRTMWEGISMLEGNYKHIHCTLYLVKQLSQTTKLLSGDVMDKGAVRDIFYLM